MDLCGNFAHTIDGKGRVSVPASFRDQLIDDHRLVLTPFTVMGQRCVEVYPYGEWQKLLAKYEALPKFSAKSIRFQMGYIGRSHRSEIDSAGRILLQPSLRQHADLKRDVVVLGQYTMFRLMDEENYRKVMGELDAEAAEEDGIFEDLNL
ncbi:MAG: mraZ [Deltaproteobacteria bacterium]|nr:mraZ [Deltaproteobacteria bacterium]